MWRQNIFRSKRIMQTLAINIPKENQQNMKVMEQIFTHLSGTYQKPNFKMKWWDGKMPITFSFEIVSIGGYVQFAIRVDSQYRDLVESAFYSQYPDAEIMEVEDYTNDLPSQFPNDDYEIWGTEFKLKQPFYYPIKTWTGFEHPSMTWEQRFTDPMASLMESMGRIGAGEKLFFQVVIRDSDHDWQKEADEHAQKLGEGPKSAAKSLFRIIIDSVFISSIEEKPAEKKSPPPTTGEIIKAIVGKGAKTGFETKVRMLYVAKKSLFNPARIETVCSYMRQFNANFLNSFALAFKETDTRKAFKLFKTSRTAFRKMAIITGFKNCYHDHGVMSHHMFLNAEELATIWHPPGSEIRSPLLKRTITKKRESPLDIPIEDASSFGAGKNGQAADMPELISLEEEIAVESKNSKQKNNPSVEIKNIRADDDSGVPENLPFG